VSKRAGRLFPTLKENNMILELSVFAELLKLTNALIPIIVGLVKILKKLRKRRKKPP